MHICPRGLRICAATLALLCATAAQAELGGQVNAAAPTAQSGVKTSMRAQLRSDGDTAYTIHEQATENGVVVREFADAGGTVFAVSWHGPVKPNLQQLLGRYFPRLTAATPSGTGPVQVRAEDVVIFSGGHPRALVGRAYVPALIPEGVNINALP